jgi:hypothetical protein
MARRATTSTAHVIALRDELVRRLEAGDRQISSAKANGADATRWEDHWITLLREYEQVCRMLSNDSAERAAA